MYVKIIVTLMFLTLKVHSEAELKNFAGVISNGHIKQFFFSCQIYCNYGFITSGKNVFFCLEEHPTCVKTMAFIIGGQGGFLNGNRFRSDVEIYSSTNVKNIPSNIADFPYKVERPIAFWYKGNVLVCGGENHSSESSLKDSGESEDRCWIYDSCNNQWEQSPGELKEMRQDAVGKVLPYLLRGTEQPWVLGGQGDSNNVSSSTEYYDGNKWCIGENNYLQEGRFGACAANVNSTIQTEENELIVLIGGKKTFREVESFLGHSAQGRLRNYHNDEWSWLNHGRYFHSCETFPMEVIPEEGESYYQQAIIAAGGRNDQLLPLDTVEIWYPDEGIWKEGPDLPQARYGAGMIILDGMPSILGGSDTFSAKDNVYVFNSTISGWIESPKRLNAARTSAGYVTVPETIYSQCVDMST